MLPTMPHRSTFRRTFSFCLESSFFTISSFDLFRIYSKALSDCCLCIAFFVFVQPIVNYNFWFVAYFVLNNALWIHLHCLELRDRPSVTAFNLISSLGLRSGFMFVFNHWSWCEFSLMSFIDNINSGLFPFVSVCLCVRSFFFQYRFAMRVGTKRRCCRRSRHPLPLQRKKQWSCEVLMIWELVTFLNLRD